jgi:hypothetical protein
MSAAQADGDGVNAPEAYTKDAVWCASRGSVGVPKERGRRGEKRQELGRPSRFLGCTPQVGHPPGEPKTVRASDPLVVLGAGRAVHLGKGRTGRRSLHRKHGPHMPDRTPNANLPAGHSTEGRKATG